MMTPETTTTTTTKPTTSTTITHANDGDSDRSSSPPLPPLPPSRNDAMSSPVTDNAFRDQEHLAYEDFDSSVADDESDFLLRRRARPHLRLDDEHRPHSLHRHLQGDHAASAPPVPGMNRPYSDSEGLQRPLHRHDLVNNRHTMAHFDPDMAVEELQHLSDGDLVLTEDMTLKDRQDAINQSHPFGIRLWKPALYKKHRTIENISYADLHESPLHATGTSFNDWHVYPGNVAYFLLFGWWMAAIYVVLSVLIFLFSLGTYQGRQYAAAVLELASYLFWPFGKYMERTRRMADLMEPPTGEHRADGIFSHAAGHSSAVSENHGNEATPLLSTNNNNGSGNNNNNDINIPSWIHRLKTASLGDVAYYICFGAVILPLQLYVSAVCWLLVVSIPMAKLNFVILEEMFKEPLSIRFSSYVPSLFRRPRQSTSLATGEILLCTYKAIALQYYKYTYDGINIMFINLLPVVLFALFDGYYLSHHLEGQGIGHPIVVFVMCLVSVLPLAYFIGMAVASISSQSSFGMGAVINATFGSVVEIILYWMSIIQKKGVLVEGAIIGSFLGCMLLLPGMSMVAGGVGRWKEQRFNVKSAGVSTVLLIMALIGAFTPTLFYSTFGKYELSCDACPAQTSQPLMCTGCKYRLPRDPGTDKFYTSRTRPLMYICAAALPTAYLIGLWFTLRTHVHHIYDSHKKPTDHLLNSAPSHQASPAGRSVVSPASPPSAAQSGVTLHASRSNLRRSHHLSRSASNRMSAVPNSALSPSVAGHQKDAGNDHGGGGHDAPEWSKWKSSIILLVSTVLFSLLAELLVDNVDEVIGADENGANLKFLGLTLFALVPNVTEFMNAIAFASYGNVALSLEIGSAYSVQVALLQIPSLVLFSGLYNHYRNQPDKIETSFTLIFPQWDVYVVFFSVFLLSYTYIEGKSNYFKGSILILAYLVLVASFYFVDNE